MEEIMKKECSVVQDVLPLYLENMVSEGTKVFVEEHLEDCADCATELERLQSGRRIDVSETPEREHDADAIKAVKKKIAKRTFKAVAVVCLVFAVLFSAVLLYTGISYPVTKDSISLSTKTEGGYTYIILETRDGKSLYFDGKSEDVLNDRNEVCGKRITLYHLQYHNNFSKGKGGSMSWGCPENSYLEVVVELENDTLQISNRE